MSDQIWPLLAGLATGTAVTVAVHLLLMVPPARHLADNVFRAIARVIGRWLPEDAAAMSSSIRARIGHALRLWADRIDYAGAPRILGMSFTFELHRGTVLRKDGKGCQLAYLGGERNYERAHLDSDTRPPWIDWQTMTRRSYPGGDHE